MHLNSRCGDSNQILCLRSISVKSAVILCIGPLLRVLSAPKRTADMRQLTQSLNSSRCDFKMTFVCFRELAAELNVVSRRAFAIRLSAAE